MNIILLGFMGSGKTSIGKMLSKKNDFNFLDTDLEIEKRNQMSINNIFKDLGELFFRNEEKKLLNDIKEKNNIVLSTGGGFACNSQNIKKLNNFGLTIYLKYSNNKLFERLKKQRKERPLIKDLNDSDLKIFIKKYLHERKEYYTQADNIIECDKLDENQMLRKINSLIVPK
tara:strand:+ start:86 stop:601 length:516 start_codon:yes stop_codon:yes gene_type:complete